jgi:hypothetical protein
MSHPLVLGLFEGPAAAAAAARTLHANGLDNERLSIVAATHEAEGELAREIGGSPGAEIEDSRLAARLGELGAHLVAYVAVVLPGVGPIVAGGPLAAEFGEAAGHVAGGIAGVLREAGVDEGVATMWQARVDAGAVLLGAHVAAAEADGIEAVFRESGALDIVRAEWCA